MVGRPKWLEKAAADKGWRPPPLPDGMSYMEYRHACEDALKAARLREGHQWVDERLAFRRGFEAGRQFMQYHFETQNDET